MEHFDNVKEHLLNLEVDIMSEDREDGTFVIRNEDEGIEKMVLTIDDPILILEQHLFNVSEGSRDVFAELLQKNRDLVHGAFALDESGKKVLFRDTLQVESLDLNELEGSINALSMMLSEYSGRLLEIAEA